jgi:hypothetical protein
MVTEAVPEEVSVTVCAAEVELSTTLPKARLVVLNVKVETAVVRLRT